MQKLNLYRKIRILIAAHFFGFFIIGFASVRSEGIPNIIHGLAHFQFVPSVLIATTGVALPLVILLAVTLIYGRIYCSCLCPTGVLQDAIARIDKLFRRKKKRYHYVKPNNAVRYSILGLTLVSWLVGFNAILTLIDPYGIFGRIGANIVRPIGVMCNNLVASVLNTFGNYYFTNMDFPDAAAGALIVAIAMFVLIAALSYCYGRLYCNLLCPVGTLLGLISKIALIKVKIDTAKCNQCQLCATKCKSGCIDAKQGRIDYSRCVSCADCLSVCKRNAIGFKYAFKKNSATETIDKSKRSAMATTAGLTTAAILALRPSTAKAADAKQKKLPIMPPGAQNSDHFRKHCTACHLCVAKCPTQTIVPSFLEYGASGILQPMMRYKVGAFCNYDCTICSSVCPNGALKNLSVDEKHSLQIGKAIFDRSLCVVYTDETDCGACDEHCPTKAVHMVEYKNGLRIPEVNEELCVGCGGCESICPVRPKTAIAVSGVEVQKNLNIPKEVKKEEEVVTDFGF